MRVEVIAEAARLEAKDSELFREFCLKNIPEDKFTMAEQIVSMRDDMDRRMRDHRSK